jgi:hypothetical protein
MGLRVSHGGFRRGIEEASMWIRSRQALCGLTAPVIALTLISACGADAGNSGKPLTSRGSTTAIAAPLTTQDRRIEKWVDLEVGECLAQVPASDLGEVTATVVDCATAHQAEVYLRTDVGVDAAISDVADRKCGAGVSQYTGRPIDGSPFVVTYLIDSSQDRTSSNPAPSTVICLLQAANGQPLTRSARS